MIRALRRRLSPASALLITTSHTLYQLPRPGPAASPVPLSTGKGLYYGLARDHRGRYWTVARHALVSAQRPSEQEQATLLCLGPEQAGRELVPPRALRDAHGMAHQGGRLWVTSTLDDAVAIIDADSGACTWWEPLPRAPQGGADQFHYNTVWFEGERVWLTAHRRGPSWLLAFDRAAAEAGITTAPLARIALGEQAHNVWRQEDGELCTCSSIEGVLLGERGWQLQTGGFPRGVARLKDGWVVGISALSERAERDFSDARLLFFDRAWQPTGELLLPGAGMVLDLLPLPAGVRLRPLPG